MYQSNTNFSSHLRSERNKLVQESAAEGKKDLIGNKRLHSPENSSKSNSSDSDSDDGMTISTGFEPPVTSAEPPTKMAKMEGGMAAKMMAKMGYVEGKGLGAKAQGRVEPVALSTQRGRTGLGHRTVADLGVDYDASWDEQAETVVLEEFPKWLDACIDPPPTEAETKSWMLLGDKRLKIEDETEFCSVSVLDQMLHAKSVFDELNDRDLRNARTRANPFETIRGAIFQNRAAMKMANMDAIFDWMLSDPKDPENGDKSWVPMDPCHPGLYYFADICAGPGGFTEYMLWKRGGLNAHGFGFTLRGKDDFKLDKFSACSPEMFEPYYGGADDGDIMKPQNLLDFEKLVKDVTGEGLHFVMADGGFSVEGQENIQEILSKRLYLCQFLCALSILRPGGNFVCKLFDLFTPFSVGLIYLMYRAFEQICIHKPHTSRPANSERYIICRRLRAEPTVRKYMEKINAKLDELQRSKSSQDVTDVVPLDLLKDETDFCEYVIESNESLARRQTLYLDKYRVFAKNVGLIDTKQAEMRERCLGYWRVPDQQRRNEPMKSNPSQRFAQITHTESPVSLLPPKTQPNSKLSKESLFSYKHNIAGLDYRFCICTEQAKLVLACGRQLNFAWNEKYGRWEPLDGTFALPKDTLVYAEVTDRFTGKDKGQRKNRILRVIDAFSLNGHDIHAETYDRRCAAISKFCNSIAVHPLTRGQRMIGSVVAAKSFRLAELGNVRRRLDTATSRGRSHIVCYDQENKEGSYLYCKGISFFRPALEPWIFSWSRSQRKTYIFHPKTNGRYFEEAPVSDADKPTLFAPFKETLQSRVYWDWSPKLDYDIIKSLMEEQQVRSEEEVTDVESIAQLVQLVEKQMRTAGVYDQ